MRALARYGVYPLFVVGPVVAAWFAIRQGFSPPIASSCAVLAAGLGALCAERLLPYARAWAVPRGDRLVDFMHLAGSALVADAVTRALVAGLAVRLVALRGPGQWPARWPMAVQVALAALLSELGGYFMHRALHASPRLFRFHALHHSAERLYAVNAFRNHPVDALASTAAAVLPLALAGITPEAMALFTAFASAHLLMQHANVDYRLGPLAYVLSVGEVHRWHHSRALVEANANYGNVLLVWDLAFGTRRVPAGAPPEDVGLAGGASAPRGYLAQLVEPFTSRDASSKP